MLSKLSRIAYINGNYKEFKKSLIHIEDRGYQFADGVYEVWTYPSGIKFTFLDRNRFGNFILIKQGYNYITNNKSI